ncbi:Ig-like domain-containing protein [[Clostridium] innocuum]|nr:Ig-like domain-containing protein [[Clostridium] innocuum]MCR0260893.1 Ig-like domain-containing protein [[Clostridium] innocuum]MCR0392516.1 Ig-like domain-containing protein [[Clostridium] innocuum]MCR0502772.1 Ig-like domain-containing protein [[Clostridium] innocuum]QSI24342.1 hypothetical protein GKZ87_01895 [Erysipelotrichaceae bacterium 66202529]
MRNMKILFIAILTLSISIMSIVPAYAEAGAGNENEQTEQPSLMPNAQMYIGIPQKLQVKGFTGSLQWISENTDIAMVDADGTVHPLKSGTTDIKAVLDSGQALTCHVNIQDVILTLNTTNIGSIYTGETRTLQASLKPEAAVKWSSNNPAVATVNKGIVTARAAGTAIIYASANGKTVKCSITVKDKTISVDRKKATLYEENRLRLHASGEPAGTITWKSDKPAIASVDASGLVVAKAPGTACIRAKLNGKTAVVHITVKAIQVSLDKTSITLYLGYKDKLNVSYEPSGTPSWSSEDSKIVSVDQNGTLTPVSVGQTIARVKVNGKTAEAKVVVKQPFVKFPSKTKTLYKGETYKPAITYGPNQGTAKWSSSKKSVAKVNSKGQITAVKKGTAYITVKINGKSAKQKITVKNAITLKKPQITSVKKASRASLKISWKKVSGANKYYLYRSTTKKGKKTKVATVKGTTYTHKYIAGRRYYYHVKAASTNKYKYKTSGYSAAKYGKSADTMTVSTPYINQVQGGAVQGCEGASLLMALKAKGYTNMGYRDFLNGMPTSKNNPREGFIYSMFSNNPTNQVHWIDTPALAAYGKKFGKVEDISGASISKLKYEINRNRPVVVYVTAMFNTPQWKKYSYGSIPKNLHVVTLVGYNGRTGKYKINDPYFGVLWISKGQFENVYNSMKKAVVVR